MKMERVLIQLPTDLKAKLDGACGPKVIQPAGISERCWSVNLINHTSRKERRIWHDLQKDSINEGGFGG